MKLFRMAAVLTVLAGWAFQDRRREGRRCRARKGLQGYVEEDSGRQGGQRSLGRIARRPAQAARAESRGRLRRAQEAQGWHGWHGRYRRQLTPGPEVRDASDRTPLRRIWILHSLAVLR
jgi:hypothetical protein